MLQRAPKDDTLSHAFEAALRAHRPDLVVVLLRSGRPQAANDLMSAAVRQGDAAAIRLALSKGADPKAPLSP